MAVVAQSDNDDDVAGLSMAQEGEKGGQTARGREKSPLCKRREKKKRWTVIGESAAWLALAGSKAGRGSAWVSLYLCVLNRGNISAAHGRMSGDEITSDREAA